MGLSFHNSQRTKLFASVSLGVLVLSISSQAIAQTAANSSSETVIVTGSSIKRKILTSALPLQIITLQEIEREGISSTEQLMMNLTANGNGPENLASNADVVSGAQRGNNGASSANLRGQGSAGTLVLFNGRRVAAHGLNGGAVDINQIPFAAIERVDVLKDGASAIYGTDAIGGVINFISKKNFQGINIRAFTDITEAGGSEIFNTSIAGGYGDLNTQKFNIMGTLSYSDNKALDGKDRDWLNGFQPNRGLSIDTRGTPYATIFPLGTSPNSPLGTVFAGTTTTPFIPGSTTIRASGGINPLDLAGGAGCNSIDGMQAYDEILWNDPTRALSCAWDTGRAVVLQQPISKLNFVGRGVFKFGEHELSTELMASKAESAKRFSNPQFSSNGTTSNFVYPRNSITQTTYDEIFDILKSTLGVAESRRGLPFAYRWRCIECGQREIETTTETGRAFIGLDGPMSSGWEYRSGISYAFSESESLLGSGYYYRNSNTALGITGIQNVLNTGIVNIFLKPGQTQTQAALDAIESASAKGTVLYGGKFEVTQVDGSVSGPLFNLPGGQSFAAFGFDLRREDYSFNGDARDAAARPEIFLAPFDQANILLPVSRNIKAIYGEIMLPIIKDFELTLAVRRDTYSGFGTTINPKYSFSYRPIEQLMFRGSYNTGFRVPSFNQIYNGVTVSPRPGSDIADPATCTGGIPNILVAGCAVVNPDTINGGKLDLGPEESEQVSFGAVYEFNRDFNLTLDWWKIERTNNIVSLGVRQLIDNYPLFTDRFIRSSNGTLLAIDQRWANAGESLTEGLDIRLTGRGEIFNGKWSAGIEGTYLLEKKSRLLPNAAWSASEIGLFTYTGDLGVEWKHNAHFTYSKGNWSATLTQNYSKGYTNGELPGVANGTIVPIDVVETVEDYIKYNLSTTYKGFKGFDITLGIKNLFDQDPPFAITYDSNGGSGSNWEPRVADPRGRSFTLLLNYKF